jgi:glycosyltransferase involved in cell wall biosynthesis
VTAARDLRGVRVAVANWRDPWHPLAGGAETYAWQMARALAEHGAQVRFITSRGPGQSRAGRRDGIDIIRLGGRFTVYPLVLGWLLTHRRSFDAMLDCQNGIPFFTPAVLARRVPVLCVMHHVHTAQFGVWFPAWMASIGRVLEGPVSRFVYRRHACVAVSPSTVDAMRDRLRWTGDIYLIPNGSPAPAEPAPKSDDLVWVGRLVAHKRAELLLPLAEHGFTIDVVGKGPGAETLAGAPPMAGLIRMHGFLPEDEKAQVVARSLLHLNTSQGEGWGLCVLEAAALGVPTVAFDVDGLRDAVRDGTTGWLVGDGDNLVNVVEHAVKELADPVRREQVSAACRDWAAHMSWERSTSRMVDLVAACVRARTARGTRAGAWIVSPDVNNGCTVVAEGPVLDELVTAGADVLRPATPGERLLGEAEPQQPPPRAADSP